MTCTVAEGNSMVQLCTGCAQKRGGNDMDRNGTVV